MERAEKSSSMYIHRYNRTEMSILRWLSSGEANEERRSREVGSDIRELETW